MVVAVGKNTWLRLPAGLYTQITRHGSVTRRASDPRSVMRTRAPFFFLILAYIIYIHLAIYMTSLYFLVLFNLSVHIVKRKKERKKEREKGRRSK